MRKRTSVGAAWGTTPIHAEGIPVRISVEWPDDFRVFVLDPDGNRGKEVSVTKKRPGTILRDRSSA